MPNLAKGTHVADGTCGGCGKPVRIVLNKNSIAYYFCPWATPEGERCSHHEKFGRAASDKMQRDYLAARKAPQHDEASNDPAPIRRQADRAAELDRRDSSGPDDGDGWDVLAAYG